MATAGVLDCKAPRNWKSRQTRPPEDVGRASDAEGPVEDVRVDHRGSHVLVTQELLDRPDIIAVLDQVGSKGVSEGVAARPPRDSDVHNCLPHRTLDHALVHVVPPLGSASRVPTSMLGGKDPLPSPVLLRAGKLSAKGVRRKTSPTPAARSLS